MGANSIKEKRRCFKKFKNFQSKLCELTTFRVRRSQPTFDYMVEPLTHRISPQILRLQNQSRCKVACRLDLAP